MFSLYTLQRKVLSLWKNMLLIALIPSSMCMLIPRILSEFYGPIFPLFRLLKSYLGKHLVIKTMTFVSSSFNTREINLGNHSFTRPLHNSRLWTPTSLAIHEIQQAQKGRNVESEFWVQQHGPFLKSSHMWMCYTLLSTSALLQKKKFRSSAL